MIRTILFDLDGTLLDTAPDLANALNTLLIEQGLPALPYESIRPVVSHGGRALIETGFALQEGDPGFDDLRQRLLEIYRDTLSARTRLFPGMEEVLAQLEARRFNWGVVTNKPAWLTEPLLEDLHLAQRAACIVSGDTTANRKPHPEPMLYACTKAGSQASQCVYIGDAQRDIEAGRQAGMKTLAALYGYIGTEDQPEDWGADASIENPLAILEWLDAYNQHCI
jgi:phosphoglycolate phosphatase